MSRGDNWKGENHLFAYAAYSISKIKEPLVAMKGSPRKLKGVGRATEDIILEILEKEEFILSYKTSSRQMSTRL